MGIEKRVLSVLIVEDSPILTKLYSHLLGKVFESKIDIVFNGKEAIDAVKNSQYDIIICDNQMPILDGLEFLSMSQDYLNDTFVVMCSGEETINNNNSFDIFMKKPFDPYNKMFFNVVLQKFNPIVIEDAWIENAHNLCDELKPGIKEKLLKEINETHDNLVVSIQTQNDNTCKIFHHLKGLLSYFDDDLMEDAYYFEKLARDKSYKMTVEDFMVLKRFLKRVKLLSTCK